MRTLFLTALLFVQGQPVPVQNVAPAATVAAPPSSATLYPRFRPTKNGPLSVEINQPAREAFESVATMAGVSVIFDRDYRPSASAVKLKLENADIFRALDSLTAATNTFWVPVASQTIFIADNNTTKHRDYDLSQIAAFRLTGTQTTQDLFAVTNAVRQQSGITTMVAFPKTNSLILKDSPAKVESARKLILESVRQMFGASATVDRVAVYETDPSDNMYLSDGSTINYKRDQLRPTSSGLFSLDVNEPARTTFETVAAKAGLAVLFDRDYRTIPAIALKLNEVDVFTALDMICLATRSFWVPVGDRTIFIVEDNSTKRRDMDPTYVDVVHLTGAKTVQEMNDVMNAVRQTANTPTIVGNPGANTLAFRDNAVRAAVAENLIADLDGQRNGSAIAAVRTPAYQTDPVTGGPGNIYDLNDNRRNFNPLFSQLRPTSTGPLSFDFNQPSRSAFETIAAAAGLSVIFDSDIRTLTPQTIALKLSNTDIYTALNIMSMATRTFWVPLGSQTIFVAEGSSTKHRDFDPLTIEVMDIPGAPTAQALNFVMNDIRQVLNISVMYASPRTNSLVIYDTPSKISLAKKLIGEIQKAGGAPALTPVISIETDSLGSFSNAANAGLKGYSAPAVAQLRPSVTSPLTLHINSDARRAYEILGESLGLNVMFDPNVAPGQPTAFNLENVDAIQALNLMTKQTGHFWQVVDSKTVYITSESVPSRRLYEPTSVKSFHLANVPVSELNSVVNMVRSLMNITNIMTDPASNTIDVRSTPSNLAVVEKLLSALDRPTLVR